MSGRLQKALATMVLVKYLKTSVSSRPKSIVEFFRTFFSSKRNLLVFLLSAYSIFYKGYLHRKVIITNLRNFLESAELLFKNIFMGANSGLIGSLNSSESEGDED